MGEPNTEVLDDPMRNIYWSHLKMMRACPQQYLWHKGHPDHDLGSGKGKRITAELSTQKPFNNSLKVTDGIVCDLIALRNGGQLS